MTSNSMKRAKIGAWTLTNGGKKEATSKLSGVATVPVKENCCACSIDETLKIPSNWVEGHIGRLSASDLTRSRHRAGESSTESQRAGGGGSGWTIALKVTECPPSENQPPPTKPKENAHNENSSRQTAQVQFVQANCVRHSALQKRKIFSALVEITTSLRFRSKGDLVMSQRAVTPPSG